MGWYATNLAALPLTSPGKLARTLNRRKRIKPIVNQFTFGQHDARYRIVAGDFRGPVIDRRRDTIFRARRRIFFRAP